MPALNVVVDKPLTIRSLHGPARTVVLGCPSPAGGTGDGATRCLWLTNNSVFSGFTLTNGATRSSGGDVDFIGVQMNPGSPYFVSPWIIGSPFRLFEPPRNSDSSVPSYYADYITVMGHPEWNGKFFNCVTEIRDDAGYEWYPDNDVPGTIGRGTRQIKRALNSMSLATLFTHEYLIQDIQPANWKTILEGITTNIGNWVSTR